MKKRYLAAIVVVGLLTVVASSVFAQNPVIIPGWGVGKFKLGASRKDVLRIAPNPQKNMPDHLLYENFNTGNSLKLSLTSNLVAAICFTNQQFDTAEGLRVSNFTDPIYAYLFDHYIDKDGDDAFRYRPGGLTFWITKGSGQRFGCVYAATPSQPPRMTTPTRQAPPAPSRPDRSMRPILSSLIVEPWSTRERQGDRLCQVQSMHSTKERDGYLVLVVAWYENSTFLVEASVFYSEHHNGIASHTVILDSTPKVHEFVSQQASAKGIRRDESDSAALFGFRNLDQLTPPFFTSLRTASGKQVEFFVQDDEFLLAWNRCYASKS